MPAKIGSPFHDGERDTPRGSRLVATAWVCGVLVVVSALSASCADANGTPIVLGNDDAGGAPSLSGKDEPDATLPAEAGLCNAYDCPLPYATCPGTSGLCTTNLDKDFHHCGSCDQECPTPPLALQAVFTCLAGRCNMICRPGQGDCNHLVDDGCETALDSDPANCGGCGIACAEGDICWYGACGCPNGFAACGGKCVPLTSDVLNCGACGHVCGDHPGDFELPCGDDTHPDGTELNCAGGQCGQHCAAGYGDCNANYCGDGCETRLDSDPNNCGSCGNACAPGKACIGGECLCNDERTLCGYECVDLQTDALNCGTCGNVCPGFNGGDMTPTGVPVCVLGRCSYDCAEGYADCDGHLENGCEIDLMTDPRHCGSCGRECDLAGGQPCAAGQCLTKPCDGGVVQ